MIAAILLVQAAAIGSYLHTSRELLVRVIATDVGIQVERHGRPLRFFSYREISTTTEHGSDLCIVLRNDEMVRIGIEHEPGDRKDALRTMRAGWARSHTR